MKNFNLALKLALYLTIPSVFGQTVQLDSLDIAGKAYKKAKLTREGYMVKIDHDSGVSRIPLNDLPDSLKAVLLPKKPEVEQKPEDAVDPNRVSLAEKFRIVEEVKIPNGGEVLSILIAPEFANEKGLRELVEQIRKQTINQKNTFVFFYDDLRALRLRSRAINLEGAESEIYELHFKAIYKKNGNTGLHLAQIWPKTQSGPEVVVEY
jgi:hypothetical protein